VAPSQSDSSPEPGASCALTRAGELLCWGSDSFAQIAGTAGVTASQPETFFSAPERITLPRVVAAFDVRTATFVRYDDGTLLTWGAGDSVGRALSLVGSPIPQPLPQVSHVSDVAAGVGDVRGCAIADYRLFCWDNRDGRPSLPFGVPLRGDSFPTQVSIGTSHLCVRAADGSVHCRGTNRDGELGVPPSDGEPDLVPMTEGLPAPAVELAAGDRSTCALLATGAIACWGRNADGQLGNGTFDVDSHSTPHILSF
jgi:alpha-tubulin suppressor-like RCC1 family protein